MAILSTDFKGVSNFGDVQFMSQLEANLKTWFDWGFLRIGGWSDVAIPSSTAFDGDMSALRLVDDKSYTDGQIWESARKDWVWETSVDHIGTDASTYNPTVPVITVGGIVIPSTDYHINYPLGRVVFNTAIPTASVVKASYSYRSAQVYIATQAPWWQELQYRSFRQDQDYFTQSDNGDWSVGSNHRIQMPCIILECVPRCNSFPYQLGDGSYWVEQDVLCHVMAENRSDRNNIADILLRQFDQNIWLFDNNAVAVSGDAPLDYRGEVVDNTKTYVGLVDPNTGHRWKRCKFKRTQSSEVVTFNPNLYGAVIRLTCESVLDD